MHAHVGIPFTLTVRTLAVLLWCALSAVTASAAQGLEYEVKAAYIFNLVNATDWPATAFTSASAPFNVCVARPSPFGPVLAETFHNERVGSHPVVVSVVDSPQEVAQCHLLFIGRDADGRGTLQSGAAAAPVLTVGESRAFESRGGIITFVSEAGRIRFNVHHSSAAKRGLTLSSKVLQVARQVS